MISERYRKDYEGEFVVFNARWENGKKLEEREWIPNSITNEHVSNRAVVIGSQMSRGNFQINLLENHRGGLLGSKKLQTYGCEGVWQEIRCDFFVENDKEQLKNLARVEYEQNTAVFTNSSNIISLPGRFYLIPHNPHLTAPAAAAYLAAFDGHDEIFLLGVNGKDFEGNDFWRQIGEMSAVMRAYKNVKFYGVGHRSQMPEEWLSAPNFSSMLQREFVIYADI